MSHLTAPPLRQIPGWPLLPGLALTALIAGGAILLRQASGLTALNPLIIAVVVAMLIGMALPIGPRLRPGLAFASRPVLRTGIVLLGFQLTLGQIADLGLGALAVATGVLGLTYVLVRRIGPLIGVPAPLSGLIAAGTAVCGASAILAANSVLRADDEDAAYAVACVTVFGTLAMLGAPLLAVPLGLEGATYGIWTGASIHEVAQVTAAAFQLGPEAGQAGTVTKLIRVMLLAPLVLAMAMAARRAEPGTSGSVPMPWFVFGFVAVVLLNSTVTLPPAALEMARQATGFMLAMGLAAMGLAINPQRLRARGLRPLALGALATVIAMGSGVGLIALLGL